MQLPQKYKGNFDVSSEGTSSRTLRRGSRRSAFARNVEGSPCIFQVVASVSKLSNLITLILFILRDSLVFGLKLRDVHQLAS